MPYPTISDSRWEAIKDTVRELYLVEDCSREDVMKEMVARFDFKATKAQYEARFKKWGFRKNLTEDEWRIVAHKIMKRKSNKEQSEVYIDGLPVPPKKVQKAISRYGHLLEPSWEGVLPETPKGITIRASKCTSTALPASRISSASAHSAPSSSIVIVPINAVPITQFQSRLEVKARGLTSQSDDHVSASTECLLELKAIILKDFQETRPEQTALGSMKPTIDAIIPHGLFPDYVLNAQMAIPDGESNLEILESLLSISGPTAQALVEQLLQLAILWRNDSLTTRILATGLDLNKPMYPKWCSTPLQHACTFHRFEAVQLLLASGADVNYTPGSVAPPLLRTMKAMRDLSRGQDITIDLVQRLLDAGADANLSLGESPLGIAAEVCNLELVNLLLKYGADPNFPDKHGQTPLYYVVRSKQPSVATITVIRQLLHAGANIQASCSGLFDTIINCAIRQSSIGVVQVLLDAGAIITESEFSSAVIGGQLDLVKLCFNSGAEINRRVMRLAAECSRFEIIKFLLSVADRKTRDESHVEIMVAAIRRGGQFWSEISDESAIGLEKHRGLPAAIEAAVSRGDISTLRWLLDDDSKSRDVIIESLGSSLYRAIALRRRDIVDLLLAAGADVSAACSKTGISPLLEAIFQKDADLSASLLAAGAAITTENLIDKDKCWQSTFTVLPAAVAFGRHSLIKSIIEAGVDINAPGLLKQDHESVGSLRVTTALAVAVERGDQLTVQFLIDAGAYVNALATASGGTVLAAAIRIKDFHMVSYLLDCGAEPDEEALIAAVSRDSEFMQMLFTAKLKRYKRFPKGFGCVALQHAISNSDNNLVKMLLSNGIDPNFLVYPQTSRTHTYGIDEMNGDATTDESVDGIYLSSDSESALGFAIQYNPDVVQIFLDTGADPNKIVCCTQENEKYTPLLMATEKRHLSVIKLLIEKGAHVNFRGIGNNLHTPLQVSAKGGDLAIAKFLLEHGADVNAPPRERNGASAIQFAATEGYLGLAMVLVEHGADVNALPGKVAGRTALEAAAENGRVDMVQFLLNSGARVTGPGAKQYERACRFASMNGQFAAQRLLEAYYEQQINELGDPDETMEILPRF